MGLDETRRVGQDSFLGSGTVSRFSECYFPTRVLPKEVKGDTGKSRGADTGAMLPVYPAEGEEDNASGIEAEAGVVGGRAGSDIRDGSVDLSSGTSRLSSLRNTQDSGQESAERPVVVRSGNSGANLFRDTPGRDSIDGRGGIDVVDYSGSDAVIRVTLAGKSDAFVYVDGISRDVLRNIEGIIGSSGPDELSGDDGINVLMGDGGDDIIEGGGRGDLLMGGAGADVFVYRHVSDSEPEHQDFIADLDSLSGDRIDVSDIDADSARKGFQPLVFSGQNPVPHSVWYQADLDLGWGAAKVVADVTGDLNADIVVGIWEMSVQGSVPNIMLRSLVLGTEGDDTLAGTPERELIDGLSGFDTLDVSGSRESLCVELLGSGEGYVKIGGIHNDIIRNIEAVKGGAGDDYLKGDAADNILTGGPGNDALVGGLGRDILTGGLGADYFVFNALTDGGDTILDFSPNEGDVLDFSLTPSSSLRSFSSHGSSAHSVWCQPDSQGHTVLVFADTNGDALADFSLVLLGMSSLPDSGIIVLPVAPELCSDVFTLGYGQRRQSSCFDRSDVSGLSQKEDGVLISGDHFSGEENIPEGSPVGLVGFSPDSDLEIFL